MLIGCGYNFCADKNALDPSPMTNDIFTTTTIKSGIFDHWNVTKDVTSPYSPDIPDGWNPYTIMDANFNGDLNAGNLDYLLSQITGFRIKRRRVNDFNWVTLAYIPMDAGKDQVLYNDNFAVNGIEYEYALVPVLGNTEGNYITETIMAKFDGVFLCDQNTVYRFYPGARYGSGERVQKVGVFEPYGRKYPVVVSNAMTNYETGSISATILPSDYMKTGNLDRHTMVEERKSLLDFLTNKKAKILKYWNSNSYLVFFTSNPAISYLDGSGMGIANISANYVELGDPNDQDDLYNAGLTNEVG